MGFIKNFLIILAILSFFASCEKSDDNKLKNKDTSTTLSGLTKKKETITKDEEKLSFKDKDTAKVLSPRKLKTKQLIRTKGMLGTTRGGGSGVGGRGTSLGSGGLGFGKSGLRKRKRSRSFNAMDYKSKRSPYYNNNTEKYSKLEENKVKSPLTNPLSTFSIDVDTASYSLFKSMIKYGRLNKDAVRAEEFINYFTYNYPQPKDKKPFSVITEVGPSILNKNKHIIHIGIQGRKKADEKRKNANLIFLIDTSGSMSSYNKLPLLKKSLNILTDNLTKKDLVTIVTYAGDSYVALEPTEGNNKVKIKEAINKLETYGGTNGEGGILVAYEKAKENYSKNKINRIILCTDGDFNIGVSSTDELKKLVKEKRKTGITLSSIGFGRGNYNDAIMEKLADNGNGNYFYINDEKEAKKVFSKELTANLEVIAKDVKIQVEFNPKHVASYKLIGYENRILKNEDFKNDKIDAGEIGSGHTVTALYEITLTDNSSAPLSDLRYKKAHKKTNVGGDPHVSPEIAFVKLRHKSPKGKKSKLTTYPILKKDIIKDINKASNNFRFSSAVATFALKIKNNDAYKISKEEIIKIAKESKGSDEFSYRKEFISLVEAYDKDKVSSYNGSYGRGYGHIGGRGRGKSRSRKMRARVGKNMITGNLTRAQVQRVVSKGISQIRYCYEKELIRTPGLKGNVTILWKINPEGKVVLVKVDIATLKNTKVHTCMKAKIKRWKFPAPKGGGYAQVRYPFNFRSN